MLLQKQCKRSTKIKDLISNVIIILNLDLHMDARAMEFEDGSFDGAIDKGTLDAILVKVVIY